MPNQDFTRIRPVGIHGYFDEDDISEISQYSKMSINAHILKCYPAFLLVYLSAFFPTCVTTSLLAYMHLAVCVSAQRGHICRMMTLVRLILFILVGCEANSSKTR